MKRWQHRTNHGMHQVVLNKRIIAKHSTLDKPQQIINGKKINLRLVLIN